MNWLRDWLSPLHLAPEEAAGGGEVEAPESIEPQEPAEDPHGNGHQTEPRFNQYGTRRAQHVSRSSP